MKKSYLLLHIAIILAGFTGVFGKLISLNEGLLVWYRVLLSTIILFFIVRFLKLKDPTNMRQRLAIVKAGLFITVHWVFFYASIKYSNISVGVVCYCLTSFFTAIFKPLIDRKPFRLSELLLSSLTLLGISLIFHFDSSYQVGIVCGIISSAFAALYTIYNERLVHHYDSRLINYYQMLGGTLGLGLLLPVYLYYFPVDSIILALQIAYICCCWHFSVQLASMLFLPRCLKRYRLLRSTLPSISSLCIPLFWPFFSLARASL